MTGNDKINKILDSGSSIQNVPQSHRNTAAHTNKAHSVTTRNSGVHTRTNTVYVDTAKERFHNARQGLRTRDSTFQRPLAG